MGKIIAIMSYISPDKFRRSLGHALRGLRNALATEHSFRIHVFVAAIVIVLLLIFDLEPIQTAMVVMVLMTVLVLELVNTVVERFVGLLEPRVHPYVGIIKDLMAAGVMIVSVGAILVGLLIFIPALTG
jgi:diacylglycerol kinase